MVKRLSLIAFLLLAGIAGAQPSFTSPQSVTSNNFFNGVSTAQNSADFTNVGQTVHFVFYQATGSSAVPTGIQIRITASFDGTTYFPISDDGGDPGSTSGLVVGIGAYPHVRAELVKCVVCNATNTITASYTGTSAMPNTPYGLYNPSQQVRKVLLINQNATADNSTGVTVPAPYGSMAGFIVVIPSGNNIFTGSAALTLGALYPSGGIVAPANIALPTNGANALVFPMPPTAASQVKVGYSHGTSAGGSFSAFYYFLPPGAAAPPSAQPATTSNSETVSAANTAVTATLSPASANQSAWVYSVSGRCSAGTAQLSVIDQTASNTNVWSSGATEVGTTTFKFQWNPGLNASLTVGDVVQVKLSACGAANTGTLDVQASVF